MARELWRRAQVLDPLAHRLRMRIDEAHALLQAPVGGQVQEEQDSCGEAAGAQGRRQEGGQVDMAGGWAPAPDVKVGAAEGFQGLTSVQSVVVDEGEHSRERARMEDELDQRTNSRVFVTCKIALRQLEAVLSLARARSALGGAS